MWFYDFEVFKYDWMVVFRKGKGRKNRRVVVNDLDALKEVLLEIGNNLLAGFNNYGYDDTIMAALLLGYNPYEITQRIIEHEERELNWQLKLEAPLTIDFKQELPIALSLKVIEANQGHRIVESSVPFNIQRKLTEDEIEDVIKYCDYDVLELMALAEHPERQSYFAAKVGILELFKLPSKYIKFTRAKLMSIMMKSQKNKKIPVDRLHISYIEPLNLDEFNPSLINFYKQAEHDYRGGGDYALIEKRKFVDYIDEVPHTYGFGGLHGARLKYKGKGKFVHADFASFYPALIILYNMMSRKTDYPHLFKETYEMRLEFKALKDPRQLPLKVAINAMYGALKAMTNGLFDPKQSNDVCINGQLVITDLAHRLEPFGDLIQTNTDGIIYKLDDADYKDEFMEVCQEFVAEYGIDLENHYITEIYQKDVNNYIFRTEPDEKHPEGEIEAIGMFKRWEEKKLPTNITSNSFAIVDMALKAFYMDGVSVEDTILDLYERNVMLPFQLVSKKGGTFYKMVHEVEGEFVDLDQNVNRIFAAKNKKYGAVASVKAVPKVIERVENGTKINKKGKTVVNYDEVFEYNEDGSVVTLDSFTTVANCPERTVIHNDHIKTFDKTQLDLQFYVNLCNDAKF